MENGTIQTICVVDFVAGYYEVIIHNWLVIFKIGDYFL